MQTQNNYFRIFSLWQILAAFGAAWAADAPAQRVLFSAPLSLQSKIISVTEANALAKFGSAGLTEFVVKQIPGLNPERYHTFDNSMVVAANGGLLSEQAVAYLRERVAEQVLASGFKLADPSVSQAGVATILSPFKAASGRVTWELLLVVFDRAQLQNVHVKGTQFAVLEAVFKSSIRGVVVHLFPETDLNLSSAVLGPTTLDGLRKMFDRGFVNFMRPLSAPPPIK